MISLCAAAAVGWVGPASASDPAPFPEFTFKRVKVPTGNSGPRINIQIEPEIPTLESPEADSDGSAAPTTTSFDWFWAEVSPSLSATGPGRLSKAVIHLQDVGKLSGPRLQQVQDIVAVHGQAIMVSTIGTKVSPAMVLAVMTAESAGRVDALSPKGATGLMQLMPDTAARFGVTDITDPLQNIKGGVAYLDWLMGEFQGDPILVLAGYNAGEGAVKRYEGVPPFAETRGYVPKVLAAWTVARGLCLTPPELASDGCAFRL